MYGSKCRRQLFKSRGAYSNRLYISLSVLFSETPNTEGALKTPSPPLSTALLSKHSFSLIHISLYYGHLLICDMASEK